jgi:hypothetical protein
LLARCKSPGEKQAHGLQVKTFNNWKGKLAMHKSLAVLLTSIVLGYGSVTFAREGSGNSDHSGHSGHSGGSASEHMSQQGSQNTNAQWSSDSAKGKERSGQRNQDNRNQDNNGHQSHGKGGDHKEHGKGHGKGHGKHGSH